MLLGRDGEALKTADRTPHGLADAISIHAADASSLVGAPCLKEVHATIGYRLIYFRSQKYPLKVKRIF